MSATEETAGHGPAPRDRSLSGELAAAARDARRRTLELVADLDDEQMLGPQLAIVNPPLWEIGHVGWFQEFWNLRYRSGGAPPAPSRIGARVDELYNSAEIPHDLRWLAPLVARTDTLDYLDGVLQAVLERLEREGPSTDLAYFLRLATFHEDMHGEAFMWTRQTHGLAPPVLTGAARMQPAGGPLPGDAALPGGRFVLGADRGEDFVFDNEQWAHPVEVAPFRIARAPVTNAELAAFADDGGYARRELWSDDGWAWRSEAGVDAPAYWSRTAGGWHRRRFDQVEPLPVNEPAVHVCWFEADAFCRWAGRRLPTEAEWELAASADLTTDGRALTGAKRRHPWGDEPPSGERANLDARAMGPIDVGALAAGDTPLGLRQMTGNVWEVCADDFGPYPGFAPGPYREYSEPWFGDHKTMRGGSWATRGRMLRNTLRNFTQPHRRDLFSGFRTCALEDRR